MKRLGGTDALFLSMETPNWHQHVAGLSILDPEGRTVTFEDFVTKLGDRIRYAPKFTWKLKEMPFGFDRPVWVDDPAFDVRRHVRRIAVPSPGGARELGELAGNLMSTQLDRKKPLWEIWYIEGLAGGKLAMLMKYHHCLLDGVSGASLATSLLDLDPDATEALVPLPSAEEASAGPEPSNISLLVSTLRPDIRRPIRTARYITTLAAKGATAIQNIRQDEENRAIMRAPKTPFNAAIGPRRELSFASVAMADVLAIKAAHEVKVNDVVLAICGGALRRYLEIHGQLPDAPLVTGVPVSTRAAGDASMDNQISQMFVSLATNEADPVDRLKAIFNSTKSAKAMSKAIGARQIQSLGEVASPLILSNVIRTVYRTQLMSRSPIKINTLVSNVPGPSVPLYMCGAKVIGVFPSSIILEGMGLNITVFSYLDRLDFGMQVDPDLVSDPWVLAESIHYALGELMTASGLGPTTAVRQPFDELQVVADATTAGRTDAAAPVKRAAAKRAPRPKVVADNPVPA